MAEQRSANISVLNDTGGQATIYLFHDNETHGSQSGRWDVAAGEISPELTVFFETVFDLNVLPDYWSVLIHVKDGPNQGTYACSGTDLDPYWIECQLQGADADQSITFTVSTTIFNVALNSGGRIGAMTRLTPASKITHVFVVMLENHSFDNMFAMSGIQGITAATTNDSNSYKGQTYKVQPCAPLSMPTDPGHEFPDVVEQLCGEKQTFPATGIYPPINNSGFAANYATSTSEAPHQPPPPQDVIDVMSCFDTRCQLPALYQLATEFAICDHWFSSLPGPTWPNRFFLHGASSSGFDDSPTDKQMAGWELPCLGFEYPNGSIYKRLADAAIPYRFYHDAQWLPPNHSLYSDDPQSGSFLGAVPQVTSLSGVSLLDFHSLEDFASDLQGPYPYPYTFIEPHYGNLESGTYAGGSSQHPMDDVYGGEHLLAAVYSAIRNSPYWNTSLLIVTYDEHGGLYDSVAPPTAPAPGDDPQYGYNSHGFKFTTFGVRVPAVVVSPLIPKGKVDKTQYDHSSVPKLLEDLWQLDHLTNRDKAANSPACLLTLSEPRQGTPTSLRLPSPSLKASKAPLSAHQRHQIAAAPVPEKGNLAGALAILQKTEAELSSGTSAEISAIHARRRAIRTRGDAQAYAASVMEKVHIARKQRKLTRRGKR